MPGRMANVFQVVMLASGANAFLRTGCSDVVAFFTAEKNILELVHARVDEKKGGVAVRDQRRGFDHRMLFLLKIVQKTFANFIARHHGFVLDLSPLKTPKPWVKKNHGA